jgi:serine/threonine-protein kinase
MIGQTISHYEILEKLGEGGMGVVYKALDSNLDRHVAIKILPPHLKSDHQAKTRFVHEAKAASALNHANIAVVHEIGETPDSQMFIVMAYYEGRTLKDKLAGGALRVDEAIEIASQLASGLGKAHEKDIVHRDIKPANILMGDDGHAKLADFGLAKLAGRTQVTKQGTTVGTVSYMSPEQASGRDVNHRSDIFSLGVVLYELLTGRLPFHGDHEAAVLYGIMNSDPTSLAEHREGLPPELQRIVDRALSKDPVDRYQTAADMMVDLVATRIGSGTMGSISQPREKKVRRRSVLVVIVALLIVVVGYVSFSHFWRSGGSTATMEKRELITIAVLPFMNMSSDSEQEYFSDGLTEELMNVLVKIPELQVTGRTSAFSFKGKSEDLRTIGDKLGVAHILEGSVRKSGNEMRVTAQLVKAEDGFHLWSETYDKTTLDNIFLVQDEIAQSVARALKVTLLDEKRSGAEPWDPAAHDLVMRARFVMREERTMESTRRARELIERAQAIDPNYAPAWTLMGSVLDRERMGASTIQAQQEILDAEREVYEKALALDPELASAHVGMAINFYLETWEFREAKKSIDRALQLDPGNPSIMQGAAYLHWALGRFEKAIDLGEQWLKAEPLYRGVYINLAHAYRGAGRLDEAEALVLKGQELWPDDFQAMLARIYLSAGRVEEARVAWDRAVEDSGAGESLRLFYYALIEHSAQNTAASDTALAEFEDKYGSNSLTDCARIRAWRGEIDAAFDWLDKAFAARDPSLAYLWQYIELQSLYSDPRWDALLEKIGLRTD